MSRFSKQDRERIMAETAATLERGQQQQPSPPSEPMPENRQADLAAAMARPLETRNQRDAREIAEQEREFARARAQQRSSLEVRLARLEIRAEQDRATIEALLLDVARAASKATDAIADRLDGLEAAVDKAAREPAEKASDRVELVLKRIEQRIDELPRRARDDDRTTIDLPPLPLRQVN
jgi:hypothetical protein